MKKRPLESLCVLLCLVLCAPAAGAAAPPAVTRPPMTSGVLCEGGGQNRIWELAVPQGAVAAVGQDGFDWSFGFQKAPVSLRTGPEYDLSASVLRREEAQPLAETLQNDWYASVETLTKAAETAFGDALQKISFDRYPLGGGQQLSIMFLQIRTEDQEPLEATVCWRFDEAYAVEWLGVNRGERSDVYFWTRRCAEAFQGKIAAEPDFIGEAPRSRGPEWALSPFANPFAALQKRIKAKESGGPPLTWTDPVMEQIARLAAEKPEGPLTAADLAFVSDLRIRETGQTLFLTVNGAKATLINQANQLRSAADMRNFPNLETASVICPGVADFSPLYTLPKLKKVETGAERFVLPEAGPFMPLTDGALPVLLAGSLREKLAPAMTNGIRFSSKSGGGYLYSFPVPDAEGLSAGPGEGAFDYAFTYPGADYSLKYGAEYLLEAEFLRRDLAEEAADAFTNHWGKTMETLAQRAKEAFGGELQTVGFERSRLPNGGDLFLMYVEKKGPSPLEAQICWRFGPAYTLECMGVNTGDFPGVCEWARRSAEGFTGEGPLEDGEYDFADGTQKTTGHTWAFSPYPDPFEALLGKFEPAGENASAADEAPIIWTDPVMEQIARAAAQKTEGDLYPSDLAFVTGLLIREWEGESWMLFVNDGQTAVSPNGNRLKSVEDLKWFPNLTVLELNADQVTDLSPVAKLTKLRTLWLGVSPDLSDLSALGGLTGLQDLMLWSGRYTKITSIQELSKLKKLRRVTIAVPSVKDVSPLASLPELEEVILMADEQADLSALKAAGQITFLNVNGEDLR